MSDPRRFERDLHAQIPLSRAMGVRVVHGGPERVVLAAPLAPNLNHRRTFFGGSASALATLSAWSLAHFRLLEEEGLDASIVIQRGTMEYLQPASGEVQAECLAPSAAEWERMLRAVTRKGKGRIRLRSELRADGAVVGAFVGSFVALRGEAEDGSPA